jgi:hypothetical protein
VSLRKLLALTSCALLAAACAPAPKPPVVARGSTRAAPIVGARYSTLTHEYSPRALPPNNFAVAGPGFALVPLFGGIVVAGFHGWYLPPQTDPVQCVAAVAKTGTVYFVESGADGDRIARIDGGPASGRKTVLATIPGGAYQMTAAADELLVWGRDRSQTWHLWIQQEGQSLRELVKGDAAISAAATVGSSEIVVAMGDDLLVLRRGAAPLRIAHPRKVIDGLAAGRDGRLFFSSGDAIYQLKDMKTAEVVALGLHGPLAMAGGNLYVLARDRHEVLEVVMR